MFLSRFRRSRLLKILLCLAAATLACGVAAFAVLWRLAPDPYERVLSWPVSPVLLDKDGRLIHARLSQDQEWCLPVPLAEMGQWLPKVLVAVEDKRFYDHGGVDFLALARAVVQNLTSGRVRSGASTITSQLVRLSTPRERTFFTKALEFFGAWKLEQRLGKSQILEYYLNRAPFGGPIRGAEAAARLYFGKRAKELSLGEASLLVGLLKGPTAYRPDRNPAAALRRRQHIIAAVAERTDFARDLTELALQEPLPAYRPTMPAKAWHFADLAFKTLPPEGGIARSTLDMRAQGLLERTLGERLARLNASPRPLDQSAAGPGSGVTAAGVVVDNVKGAIIAYVGNSRFDAANGRHWVDCALAPRSPGSTLKPFIYLAAMEEGHIIPASLLADTPLRLGGEAPRNFDLRYRGPVTAHAALAESLNAPAVRVLRMVGVSRILALLRNAGFAFLNRNDSDYGDSLALGAAEVTVLELARSYSALARLGEDRRLLLRLPPGGMAKNGESSAGAAALEQYGSSLAGNAAPAPFPPLPVPLAPASLQAAGRGGETPVPRRLYSAPAAYLVAQILKDPGRLPFLTQLVQAREQSPVAFKTGTSFGLRDAWTAAYTPSYTVVVWFGREDGGANPALLGISLAAPAAIQTVRGLEARGGPAPRWYAEPPGIGAARVCSLSGAAASAFCPSTRKAPDISDVRRTVPCSMHIFRDGKITLVWPPELEDFNRKRFAAKDLSRSALVTSPLPGARYLITPGARLLPLALKAEGVRYPVHWYVNGEYLGEQEREDAPLHWLPPGGTHSLSLLDADERIANASVTVTDLGEVDAEEPLPLE